MLKNKPPNLLWYGAGDPRISFVKKTLGHTVSCNTILLENVPNHSLFPWTIVYLTQAHIIKYTLCPFIFTNYPYAIPLLLCEARSHSLFALEFLK